MKKRAVFAVIASIVVLSFVSCAKGTYDVADGEGSFTYENGTRIEATFSSGEIVGECKVEYNNGDLYQGMLTDGKKSGYGIYIWSDETVYEGSFSEDKRAGNGKLTMPDGRVFEGEFKDDSIVSGTLTVEEKYVYTGEFSGDLPNDDNAIVLYPDGSRYEGSVKNGKCEGKGKITYPDSSCISGTFSDGLLQGSAVYTLPEATDTYINNVRYSLVQGENNVTVKDGVIVSVP